MAAFRQVAWFFATTLLLVSSDYLSERAKLIESEESMSLQGSINLTDNELLANEVLMRYKEAEWQKGFHHPGVYPTNLHFFEAKSLIETSKVFRILKQLPKGALLHTHDTAMTSYDFLFSLTYTPYLHICTDNTSDVEFMFLKEVNQKPCKYGAWQLLRTKRENFADIDILINRTLSLECDNPHESYPTINRVWEKFKTIFLKVSPLLTYKPIFEKYHYQALQELYDDNVRYVELRTVLPSLYDLKGRIYMPSEVVDVYKVTTQQFKDNHPDFIGCRIIYAPPRHVTNETMGQYVEILRDIKSQYPDFVLGFDLVGQEDTGRTLKDSLDYLLPLRDTINFYFHAGETNWYGSSTDENLIDAILLGSKRIGHGYALLKHPEVLRLIRANRIAIEVSPISNQVLKLVDDIRNHPGAIFGALNLPMVITNDDPSYWGARGLSYDWYVAFMGIASRRDDLRYLKKLAMNSLQFSGLPRNEMTHAFRLWNVDWEAFIAKLANDSIV